MPPAARTHGAAHEPAELHAIIQDAVNAADIDAFLAAHDEAATVVLPPDGAIAHGHDEIRAAIAAVIALQPSLTITPSKTLESDGLALVHGRWRLTVLDDGSRIELSGLGTMVSRQVGDGTWRVLLDDPLTGP